MDFRTLLVADYVVQVCCALGLLLMSRSVAGLRGLRWFAWAYAAVTAGLVMVSWPEATRLLLILWLGRLLVLLGAVLMSQGIAEFAVAKASVLGWGGSLLALVAPLELYALAYRPELAVAIFAMAFAAQMLVCVLVLLSHQAPGERAASRTMASVLAGVAGLCVARAMLSPLRLPVGNLSDSALGLGLAFTYLVLSSTMAFGFVWMMTARLRNQLEMQARTDALTGVLNRRALEATAVLELAACQRRQSPLAILAIDLDHFKFLNDAYGHAAGDLALASTAGLLVQCLRSTDMVARFGGEEFVAVLPDRDGMRASLIAERLRSRLEEMRVEYEGQQLALTASFGVAVSGPGDTWSALLRRADRALYEAKRTGRNCIRGESSVLRPAVPRSTSRPGIAIVN